HRSAIGDLQAADGAVALLDALLAISAPDGPARAEVTVTARGGTTAWVVLEAPEERAALPEVPAPTGELIVPHSGPPVRLRGTGFRGAWGGDRVPVPLPRRGQPVERVRLGGSAEPAQVPLSWS